MNRQLSYFFIWKFNSDESKNLEVMIWLAMRTSLGLSECPKSRIRSPRRGIKWDAPNRVKLNNWEYIHKSWNIYVRKNWKTGKSSWGYGDHSNIKNVKSYFFRLSLFFHGKSFYYLFFPNFSLTKSDTVGPQLFTWSTKFSKLSHQSAEIIFLIIKILLLIT